MHTDGTIFTTDGDTVVGIDPVTGLPKFSIQLEDSISSTDGNCGEFTPSEFSVPPDFGTPIIAGDGFAYIPYTYTRAPLASNMIVCNADGLTESIHVDVHFRVLRVGTDGSATKVILGDWSQDVVIESGRAVNSTSTSGALPDNRNQFGTLITNADQGVFYSWDLGFNGASPAHQLTTINGSSASTISLPVPGSFQPMLQGSDGTLFGTVSLPPDPSGQPGSSFMIALDTLHQPKWTLPNVSPQYATPQGGTIITSTFTAPDGSQQLGSLRSVDSLGNQTNQIANLGALLAWSGNWYGTGALNASSTVPSQGPNLVSYTLDPITLDSSFWPALNADPSQSSDGRRFTKEITVIGWINGDAVEFPTQSLVDPLVIADLSVPSTCPLLLGPLSAGVRGSFLDTVNTKYVNAFLISQSANSAPPDTLVGRAVEKGGDYRAYNRTQAVIDPIGNQILSAIFYNTVAISGDTPDACHSPFTSLANYIAFGGKMLKSEPHPDNDAHEITPGRLRAFHLAEGRVGSEGQKINRTLNHCLIQNAVGICEDPVPPATPYIWALTKFDYLGQYTIDTQIFPTYYVYENGIRVPSSTISQGDLELFLSLNAQSQVKASDIR